MTKEQVLDLLDFLELSYSNFKTKEGMLDAWYNELQMYDEADVKINLKHYMGEERFQNNPPLVALLIRGLTPKKEKVDFSKVVYFCQRCHKAYNNKEDLDKHFDRCSSVDFVIRETKKWSKKDLTRKELFEMSDDEFEKKYNELLLWIYNHTDDEAEKTRINFFFNPPSSERAKKFLDGVS